MVISDRFGNCGSSGGAAASWLSTIVNSACDSERLTTAKLRFGSVNVSHLNTGPSAPAFAAAVAVSAAICCSQSDSLATSQVVRHGSSKVHCVPSLARTVPSTTSQLESQEEASAGSSAVS